MWERLVYFALFCVVLCSPKGKSFHHFEDYLNSLGVQEKAWIASTKDDPIPVINPEGSGDDEFLPDVGRPLKTGITKDKDITCCMLGSMAGDKGYHCYAKFYVARILMRNKNRAHNRKMAFYGHEKIPNYGEKIMKTFEQCVAVRSIIFHKCCHLAAMDRVQTPHYDSTQRKKYMSKHKTVPQS